MSTSSGVESFYKRKMVTKLANFERNSSSFNPIVCSCEIVAPMWEVWKDRTLDPGRKFVGCSMYKDKKMYCGFLKWCDPPFTEKSREVIKKLRDELCCPNEEIQRVKLFENITEPRVVKDLKKENA